MFRLLPPLAMAMLAVPVGGEVSDAGLAANVAAPAPARCKSLLQHDFAAEVDAPAYVTAARLVDAAASLPAFCQVQGYVAPNTGFEIRLPVTTWNGKFFYAGCTGSCGFAADSVWVNECNYPLSKGYACIVSDMGHRSTASDGLWAYRNLAAKVDFGFRATHRTAVAGKAITNAFYDRPPAKSYFMGCSTGGRQALVSAQRFPWDFDGIIAGAPVISEAGTSMSFIWNLAALAPSGGRPLFTAKDLQLVHAAALAAGDLGDGIRDGVIGDPRSVKLDLTGLVCRTGRSDNCLSQKQAAAVAKVYAGPQDSKGAKLYSGGGFQPGSEMNWLNFVTPPGGQARSARSGEDTTRYIMTDWGTGWRFSDFDFDRDYKRMGEMEVLYSASNPDLRAFEAAGGKLIIYHGWNDGAVAPLNSVDYYEMLERAAGGKEATQSFARLFMVPGMNHCFSGQGAFAIDYISYLEDWVERGRAPDRMIATHLRGDHESPSMIRRFPFDPRLEVFTRPVFPYPLQARYRGSGDPASAASFEAFDPTR